MLDTVARPTWLSGIRKPDAILLITPIWWRTCMRSGRVGGSTSQISSKPSPVTGKRLLTAAEVADEKGLRVVTLEQWRADVAAGVDVHRLLLRAERVEEGDARVPGHQLVVPLEEEEHGDGEVAGGLLEVGL